MAPPRNVKKCAARGGMTKEEVVAAVFERDKSRCAKCGMGDDEHTRVYGRSLEVHRLVPGSMYSVAGCVLRCVPCHSTELRRTAGTKDLEAYPSFMVRFPADLRELFEEVKRVSGQPFTTAGRRAMEDYARRLGIEPGRK